MWFRGLSCGISGLDVFLTEKPFRVVSCGFVECFFRVCVWFVDGGGLEKKKALLLSSAFINFQFSVFNFQFDFLRLA